MVLNQKDGTYDLDSDTIAELAYSSYYIPGSSRVHISNDETQLFSPRQIGNSGIYFETNLSARGVFSFIKALLEKMQLEDDFSFSLSEN